MSKKLERACKKNSYDKICAILTSQSIAEKKTGSLQISDKEQGKLKEYVRVKIMESLRTEGRIPKALLKLAAHFGDEYFNALRIPVTNFIVGEKAADFTQILNTNYCGPESLGIIYEHIERKIEKLDDRFAELPADWNIDLRLLTLLLSIVKQKVSEGLSISKPSPENLSKGIYETIRFEKKIRPFLVMKKCCATHISFTKDQIISNENVLICPHVKMLSVLFLPFLESLLQHSLGQFSRDGFKVTDARLGIINHFLLFFKEVERILSIVLYFESQLASEKFAVALDEILLGAIRKLKPEGSLVKAVIVMSTIVFIQDTLRDLLDKLHLSHYGSYFSLKSFDMLSRTESLQSVRIERVLSASIPPITASCSWFSVLKPFFEKNVLLSVEMGEEVKQILLEASMSLIFGKVSSLPMSQKRAETLLMEIGELEHFLMERCNRIPHIKLIKEYLQIFACPSDDKTKFVENFLVLGAEKFSFYHILNAMENQDEIAEFFILYKKLKKSSQC